MASRALPDLVARLRLDKTQFTAETASLGPALNQTAQHLKQVEAAATGTGQGFDSITGKLHTAAAAITDHSFGLIKLTSAHGAAGAAAQHHSSEVGKLENVVKGAEKTVGVFEQTLGALGVSGEGPAGRAAQRLSSTFSGLGVAGAGLAAALGGLAVGGGVFALLEKLATETALYSKSVMDNSRALGMDAESYQVLQKTLEKGGVAQDQFNTLFLRFNKNLGEGAPLLRAQGGSLEAVGIHATNATEAYRQFTDWISKSSDAQLNAVAVQALFGKGAEALLPILLRGTQYLDEEKKKLEEYGQILNNNQVVTGAFAAAVRQDLGEAFKGILTQIGIPLEQGFTELWLVVIQGAKDSKGAMKGLGEALGSVIGWLAGFLNGLLNLGLTTEKVNEITKGYAKELTDQAKAQALANQQQAVAQSAATKAKADIKALTEETKDQTAAIAAQVKELGEEQRVYDQSIDQRIRLVQAMDAQLSTQLALIQAARTAEADADRIAKDQAALNTAIWQGNYLEVSKLGDQLTTDKATQADDQAKAAINGQQRANALIIAGLTEEKRARDEVFRARMQQLNDTSAAMQASADAQITALQEVVDRGSKAFENLDTSGSTTAVGIADAFAHGFAGVTVNLNTSATQWGDIIHRWVMGQTLTDDEQKHLDDLGGQIGGAIAVGIVKGMVLGIGTGIAHWILDSTTGLIQQILLAAFQPFVDATKKQGLTGMGGSPPGAPGTPVGTRPYAQGGWITEPVLGRGMRSGLSYSFAESRPEFVLPPDVGGRLMDRPSAIAAVGGGGQWGSQRGNENSQSTGGNTFNFHFPNYLGPLSEVQRAVVETMAEINHR